MTCKTERHVRRTRLTKTVVAATLCLIGAGWVMSAAAAPIIYFGEDQNANGAFVPGGDSEQARNQFLSHLTGVGNEDFESFTSGTPAPLALTFPGSIGSTINATITGSGSTLTNANACCGRFATSGQSFYEVSGTFDIAFSNPISAFGFYATDVGDFNGQLTLTLIDGTTMIVNLTVPNTVNGNDGSLLFWGFIDPTQQYTKVSFGNTAPGVDYFGFDDMVIGDAQQIHLVPEPSTLLLFGAGLGLLGLMFRRRRQALDC